MSKPLLVAFLLLSIAGHTQPKWGWDIAAAGAYGKNVETIGPQFRAYVLVNEQLCFGPEFTWIRWNRDNSSGQKITNNLYEVNFNVHYVFEFGHHFGAYPLAGINWSKEVLNDHSIQDIGMNIGGGAHAFLGRWVPFAEYAYLVSNLSDHKVILGTYFIIRDIEKKRHKP